MNTKMNTNQFYSMLSLILCLILTGCSSSPEPFQFVIEKQNLHTKKSAGGVEIFAFVVTVEGSPLMEVDRSKPMSKRELKRFAAYQRIEDSPELKLALEDLAVERLQGALTEQEYCLNGYQIDEVFWRQRSVQLRCFCL